MNDQEPSRGPILWGLSAFLIYLVAAVAMFASTWRHPLQSWVGLPGDPQLFTWLLGWTQFAITHGQNPLLTYYLNYPEGANLMWNTAQTVPGLIMWPVLALAGPLFAFNVMFTLALPLSAWFAYLAFVKLVPSRIGALVGGLVYGFSPYMLAHALGHPNFVICLFPPIVLLLLTEILVVQRRPVWQPAVLLGLAAAAQLLTGEEILATTAMFTAIGVALALVLFPHDVASHVGYALRGLVIGLAVFLVLGAVPLATQFLGPQRVFGHVRAPDVYVNDLLTFFVPSNVFLFAPDAATRLTQSWTGNAAEWNSYVGIPLALLLLWMVVRYRSVGLIRWCALLGVFVAILSLGPHLHLNGMVHHRVLLPWILVQDLPIFRDIIPARLSLYFFLVVAIAIAYLISRLDTRPVTWSKVGGLAAVVISLLPLLPMQPWPTTERPLPSFFTGSEVKRIPPGSVALVAPFTTEPGSQPAPASIQSVDPQSWQVEANYWFRMPAGYMRVPGPRDTIIGGPLPTTTQDVMVSIAVGQKAPVLTPELRARIVGDLEHWKVKTVIVGPMANQAEMVNLFREFLGREPEETGDVFVWWDVEPARLH